MCYEKMREFDEAISHLLKATRRDKWNFTAFYKIGLCYIRNNMKTEGIEALKHCLVIQPENLDVMIKLTEVYQKEDKYLREAENMIKKIISKDPSLPEPYVYLGKVLDKRNDNQGALEAFKKGLDRLNDKAAKKTSSDSNADKKASI